MNRSDSSESAMTAYTFQPIGFIKSPFKEKFGMPRQSLMFKEARGVLKLNKDPRFKLAVQGLETFSHVWILFVFHGDVDKEWRPQIMPPRPDELSRVGVLGSRSPHRPNPIGISVCKIEKINTDSPDGVEIHLSGLDLLDGTPVLDIKPYLPFADRVEDANSGWAHQEIKKYPVQFSDQASQVLSQADPQFKNLLLEILERDPRPTSLRRDYPMGTPKAEGKRFSFRLMNYDTRCEIRHQIVYVREILDLR